MGKGWEIRTAYSGARSWGGDDFHEIDVKQRISESQVVVSSVMQCVIVKLLNGSYVLQKYDI